MLGKSKEELESIRKLILKRDAYACRRCGVLNKSRVYLNSKKDYVLCDEFMEEWATANGKKVFSVGLQVVKVNDRVTDFCSYNLITLCQKCLAKHKKIQKRFKRKLFQELIDSEKEYRYPKMDFVNLQRHSWVRNYIKSHTSVVLDTSTISKLINYITKK